MNCPYVKNLICDYPVKTGDIVCTTCTHYDRGIRETGAMPDIMPDVKKLWQYITKKYKAIIWFFKPMHRCRYCGQWTKGSDNECYRNSKHIASRNIRDNVINSICQQCGCKDKTLCKTCYQPYV